MARLQVWEDRWTDGRIDFHQTEVNESLVQFKDKLLIKDKSRVFVPLCGKTVDLKWFADQGHEVVGVEGIDQPVTEFFQEQKLSYTKSDIHGVEGGKLYESEDGRIKIFVSDLFNLTRDILGQFDAVWDRGSVVAVDECDRKEYAKVISSLLSPGARMLLVTVNCDPAEKVKDHKGEKFTIELLSDVENLEKNPRFRRRGFTWMRELVHVMTLK
ncbi:probable thiopurine S-methyltransferase [Diadema antillarum]|uniref:probable thiopurine S-methyltransferase n=1 Tax=Diadema antillarum TaxID=105358 RepID=UPI003A8C7A78